MSETPKLKPVGELTEDELAQEIMEQVQSARNVGSHDRKRTRAISEECQKRGWNPLRLPKNS